LAMVYLLVWQSFTFFIQHLHVTSTSEPIKAIKCLFCNYLQILLRLAESQRYDRRIP
jgi:hypothetical protein